MWCKLNYRNTSICDFRFCIVYMFTWDWCVEIDNTLYMSWFKCGLVSWCYVLCSSLLIHAIYHAFHMIRIWIVLLYARTYRGGLVVVGRGVCLAQSLRALLSLDFLVGSILFCFPWSRMRLVSFSWIPLISCHLIDFLSVNKTSKMKSFHVILKIMRSCQSCFCAIYYSLSMS